MKRREVKISREGAGVSVHSQTWQNREREDEPSPRQEVFELASSALGKPTCGTTWG